MRTLLISTSLLFTFMCFAQNSTLKAGIEYNYYPAGHIVGIQSEYAPNATHHAFNARLASNITFRKDFSGLNDDERGIGFGGGLGYRYYFKPEKNSFFLGARVNFWSIDIDWQDSSEVIKEGTTKIGVLQPEFEVGYLFGFGNGWDLGLAITNGIEMNVIMEGEPVGEGWITLVGIRLSKTILNRHRDNF